jgi:putative ABC transport system permease protein
MALGANPRTILTNVLREGLVMAAIGVTVGLGIGFVFARVVARYVADAQLPGVISLIASAAIILAAAVIASAVPAARAATVNPVEVLRSE